MQPRCLLIRGIFVMALLSYLLLPGWLGENNALSFGGRRCQSYGTGFECRILPDLIEARLDTLPDFLKILRTTNSLQLLGQVPSGFWAAYSRDPDRLGYYFADQGTEISAWHVLLFRPGDSPELFAALTRGNPASGAKCGYHIGLGRYTCSSEKPVQSVATQPIAQAPTDPAPENKESEQQEKSAQKPLQVQPEKTVTSSLQPSASIVPAGYSACYQFTQVGDAPLRNLAQAGESIDSSDILLYSEGSHKAEIEACRPIKFGSRDCYYNSSDGSYRMPAGNSFVIAPVPTGFRARYQNGTETMWADAGKVITANELILYRASR